MSKSSLALTSLLVCLEHGALSARRVLELVARNDFGFKPTKADIRSDEGDDRGRWGPALRENLADLSDFHSITIEGTSALNPPPTLSVRSEGRTRGINDQSLRYDPCSVISGSWVNEVLGTPGVHSAFLGNWRDGIHQSDDRPHVSLRNYPDIPLESYKHIPDPTDKDYGYKLDISHRHGRYKRIPRMFTWAAPEMWFGPGFFGVVDRDRVLSAPSEHTEVLESGLVHVRLFDPADELGPMQRERQAAFRAAVGFSELEDAGFEREVEPDPMTWIIRGEFPHGGVMRVSVWVDDEGEHVRRSQATAIVHSEQDASGKVIHEEQIPWP